MDDIIVKGPEWELEARLEAIYDKLNEIVAWINERDRKEQKVHEVFKRIRDGAKRT